MNLSLQCRINRMAVNPMEANKVKIYLSGPIFSRADIEWAKKIKARIEKQFGSRVEVIWPHEIASGAPQEIFQKNISALKKCPLVVAILEGSQVDDGTAWELGYHYARGGKILGLRTDFRRAGETHESKVNVMIEFSCHSIANSLDQLLLNLSEVLEA